MFGDCLVICTYIVSPSDPTTGYWTGFVQVDMDEKATDILHGTFNLSILLQKAVFWGISSSYI